MVTLFSKINNFVIPVKAWLQAKALPRPSEAKGEGGSRIPACAGGHALVKIIQLRWRLIFLLISLYILSSIYIPVFMAELHYQAHLTKTRFYAVFSTGFKGILAPTLNTATIPTWAGDYGLFIPKLDLKEKVVKDTNANIKDLYQLALKSGVAHAAGSAYPGSGGVSYYFAHSSGLPFWGARAATFATLSKLDLGDQIIIYFQGRTYTYQVNSKRIVDPSDTSFLMDSSVTSQSVVLQTCWPLGTDLKRLLIVASPQN